MILVDTSVWINHLRRKQSILVNLLEDDHVLMHPWVLGEIALGSLADRTGFIRMLSYLPKLRPAKDEDIFTTLENLRLFSRGIGWVDAGLITSCLQRPCRLWTHDKKLKEIVEELHMSPAF
jgi:hypothetical protein